MKSVLYNKKGEKTGEVELDESVWNKPMNSDLLYQAVNYYRANARCVIANTKDRSEVRGGGRKPWRQKGTGRARHGSVRSPIFIGGGVTFGPNLERNYKVNLGKKSKKEAVNIVLSQKLRDGEVLFVDELEVKEQKTKKVKELFGNLSKIKEDINSKKVAFVLSQKKENFLRSLNNIEKTDSIPADCLNSYFILKNRYLVIEKPAIDIIQNKNNKSGN